MMVSMNVQGFGLFNEVFARLFAQAGRYDPSDWKCDVCGRSMLPVGPGVQQFSYSEVHRKEHWTPTLAIVCCELCATDYEDARLHKRYPILDKGFVYLMRSSFGHKIGFSGDPEVRTRQLQRRYREPIDLLHVISAPHKIGAEKYLQYRYRDLQIEMPEGEREWFKLSEKEISYIRSLAAIDAWKPYSRPNVVVVKFPWKEPD